MTPVGALSLTTGNFFPQPDRSSLIHLPGFTLDNRFYRDYPGRDVRTRATSPLKYPGEPGGEGVLEGSCGPNFIAARVDETDNRVQQGRISRNIG